MRPTTKPGRKNRPPLARTAPPAVAPESRLTVTPAELFGVSDRLGTVEPGKSAHLVVTDGDLFDEQTKVVETWVAGEQFVIEPAKDVGVDELVGRWRVELR